MKHPKLDELEKRARALLDDQSFVTVSFSNGQRRKMRLCDVIPLLRENETGLTVTAIDGDAPKDSGLLLEILRGLIEQPEIEGGFR